MLGSFIPCTEDHWSVFVVSYDLYFVIEDTPGVYRSVYGYHKEHYEEDDGRIPLQIPKGFL